MSVPSTLQQHHEECGGTVVFRPATHRRALLNGDTVTLRAACRSCGDTVSTEFALEEAQLVSLDARRAERAKRTERRQEVPVATEAALPMAAGGESQVYDVVEVEHEPELASGDDVRHLQAMMERSLTLEEFVEEHPAQEAPAWGEFEDAPVADSDDASMDDLTNEVIALAAAEAEAAAGAAAEAAASAQEAALQALIAKELESRVSQVEADLSKLRTDLPSVIKENALKIPELRRPAESAKPSESDVAAPVPAPQPAAPVAAQPEPVPAQPASVQPEPVPAAPAAASVPVQPAAAAPTEPAAQTAPGLPRVELAASAPAPVPTPPVAAPTPVPVATPLHERITLASTDADVLGRAREVEVLTTPAFPADAVEQMQAAPAVAPSVDEDFSFADVGTEADSNPGFDWSGDDPIDESARTEEPSRSKGPRKPKRDRARSRARAKAKAARQAAAPRTAGGSVAVARRSSSTGRVIVGLPELGIIMLLLVIAVFSFMRLTSDETFTPASANDPSVSGMPEGAMTGSDGPVSADDPSDLPSDSPASSATDGAAVPPPATAKAGKSAGAASAAALTPLSASTAGAEAAASNKVQVPADAADTASEATQPTSPSSTPSPRA